MLSNSLIQLKTLDRQMPVNISGNTQLEGPLKLCSGQGWTRVLQHRTSPPRIGGMDSERTGVIWLSLATAPSSFEAACSRSCFSSHSKAQILGTSLAVQWIQLGASNAGVMGLIPGEGMKIPHAVWCSQIEKRKRKEEVFRKNGL